MAKSAENDEKTTKSTQSSGLRNVILILPLIAILALVWLILIRLDQLPESLTFGQDFQTWLNFWMVVFVILIVILICIPQSGKSAEVEELAESGKAGAVKKVKKPSKPEPTSVVTVEAEEKPAEFVPVAKKTVKTSKPDASLETSGAKKAGAQATTDKTAKEAEEAKPEFKFADVVAMPAAKDNIKPKVLEYPTEVEGGIYGDTFIDVDPETVLKLRTLVVRDVYLL
jgi:hypothetical protein